MSSNQSELLIHSLLLVDESASPAVAKEPDSADKVVEEVADSSFAEEPLAVETEATQVEESQTTIKDEPCSPKEPVDVLTPSDSEQDPPLPTTLPPGSLENLLGIPDDAPLKVERRADGIVLYVV